MKTKFLTFALLFLGITLASSQNIIPYLSVLGRHFGTEEVVTDPNTGHKVIYYFGGMTVGTGGAYKNDILKMDMETWEITKIENSTGDLPPKMVFHSSSIFDGKIFIYGGFKFDDNNQLITNLDYAIYIYDIANNHWTLNNISPSVISRKGMTSVENGAEVHLVGGKNADGTISNQYQLYDMNTNTVTQKTSINMGGIDGSAALIDNNKLYLIGGQTDYGISGNILVYDLINNFWSTTGIAGAFAPSTNALIGHIGAHCLVWGGITSGSKKSTNSISTSLFNIYFDMQSNQLISEEITSNLPPLANGVSWVDIASGDTIIYAFSGINNITTTGDTAYNTNFYRYNITDDIVQQFDTTQQTWGGLISSINGTEFKTSKELSVYPNPANEQISVSLQTNEPIRTLKIYNQNGQLVQLINSKANIETINISNLTGGIYYLRIDTDKNFYLGKLIKK